MISGKRTPSFESVPGGPESAAGLSGSLLVLPVGMFGAGVAFCDALISSTLVWLSLFAGLTVKLPPGPTVGFAGRSGPGFSVTGGGSGGSGGNVGVAVAVAVAVAVVVVPVNVVAVFDVCVVVVLVVTEVAVVVVVVDGVVVVDIVVVVPVVSVVLGSVVLVLVDVTVVVVWNNVQPASSFKPTTSKLPYLCKRQTRDST